MKNSFPPLPVRILVLVIVLSTIGYYAFRSLNPADDGQLKASGTIEAVVVNISPEVAGKVTDVLVGEGQSVQADAALLSLDASLLTAQKAVASAQVDSAKAALNTAQSAYETAQQQYNTTLTNALASEKATRTSVWKDTKPTEFNLPTWFFSKTERLQAAQSEVGLATTALKEAQEKLDNVQQKSGSAKFLDVEAALAQARITFQNAKTVLDLTSGGSDIQNLRDEAQIIFDDAKIALEDAQKEYDDELTTEGTTDVLEARAKVVVAQEIYDNAADNLRALQTGVDSQPVMTAEKALDQAKAAMDQAEANIKTAEANLALLDAQMQKLSIHAPMNGVILVRNVEPGEFVQPGAVALTMADLNNLTITVYVPEDRYGEITLGQEATVTVDSFPGESFTAEVIHIASQAEFTPRNVQTVEGRSSTVYAIKLKVTDTEGKLKIGMPADVVFK